MIDPNILIAVKAGVELLPSVIGAIESLVALGHPRDEAAEIVKKDIESRAAEYARMRAEDRAALARKHGVPDELAPNPYDAPREPG
jgi:hypothetical protein